MKIRKKKKHDKKVFKRKQDEDRIIKKKDNNNKMNENDQMEGQNSNPYSHKIPEERKRRSIETKSEREDVLPKNPIPQR